MVWPNLDLVHFSQDHLEVPLIFKQKITYLIVEYTLQQILTTSRCPFSNPKKKILGELSRKLFVDSFAKQQYPPSEFALQRSRDSVLLLEEAWIALEDGNEAL